MSADHDHLRHRLGSELHAKRLKRQTDKVTRLLHQGTGIFRLERIVPFDNILAWFLRACGVAGTLRRQYLDIRIVHQEWVFPDLPPAFEGFRLLHLTDLHCDLDQSLAPLVEKLVRATPHDAAVVTGDFRNGMEGCHETCMEATKSIVDVLSPARWSVLGNHDFLEMVPALEQMGLPVLLNETAVLGRGGDALWFAGIDDPHYYQTHDLAGVKAKVPAGAFSILLSHSPETYREADQHGFHLQLSGHTHGGQICLPGRIPVVVPCRIDRQFVAGRWKYGRLQGYTSPGTGACGVSARWNCPPEITVHTLRRAAD